MSSSNVPHYFQVVFAPDFKGLSGSLQDVLPPPNATTLDENLLSRIQALNEAIEPPVDVGQGQDRAKRCCQHVLWNLAIETGLTLRAIEAACQVAKLDTDGLITFQLIACINSILEAGLENGLGSVSSKILNNNTRIIQAAARAIPRVIGESWRNLSSKVRPEAPAEGIAPLGGLVHLACVATELIECGKVTNAANSTELYALRELKSQMLHSEAFRELMLQFIIHPNDTSNLKVAAITSLFGLFGSRVPSLLNAPKSLDNFGMALSNILMRNDSDNLVDLSRYSPTVDAVHTILSSDHFRVYFQATGSTHGGSDGNQGAMDDQNKLCAAISDGYWEWLRKEWGHLPEGDRCTLSIRALIVACCLMSLHLSTSLLIFQRSFLPLVARGLLAWQLLGDNALKNSDAFESSNWQSYLRETLLDIGNRLQALSSDRSIRIVASTGFIETIDNLQLAKQINHEAPTNRPLAVWKEFCEVGQLTQQDYRQERDNEGMQRFGNQPGCRWLKCPLFGTETMVGETLVCDGCKMAVYCRELCRRSDFEAHRTECQGPISRKPSKRDRRGNGNRFVANAAG
ncbi:hypothetical protein FRC01_001217 [Tulasnella sp. 417]|nr:hypothetical protein FRC01_001217 [Tulasnella sp. 417]